MTQLTAEFNVLPLGEACARFTRGALPARAACITFDDGYANNKRTALSVLKRLGLPATFFVSIAFSDGGIMFNDGVIEAVRRAPAGIHDLSSLGVGSHIFSDDTSRRATVDALIRQLMYRPREVRDVLVEQLAAAMHSTFPKNQMEKGVQGLVIGGSRGLGELTAKLLCVGSGAVHLIYARGPSDARLVNTGNGIDTANGFRMTLPRLSTNLGVPVRSIEQHLASNRPLYEGFESVSRLSTRAVRALDRGIANLRFFLAFTEH